MPITISRSPLDYSSRDTRPARIRFWRADDERRDAFAVNGDVIADPEWAVRNKLQ